MPIREGRALERRKNETEAVLPPVRLTEEETALCGRLAHRFVADRADGTDIETVTAQLGRYPRGIVSVAARCRVCGTPLVVVTRPLLTEGVRRPTPFPTTFYLTSPEAVKAVSRLEATGVMARLTARLAAGAGPGAGTADMPVGVPDGPEGGGDHDGLGGPDKLGGPDRLDGSRLLERMTRAHLLYCRVREDLAGLLGDDITHIRTVGVGGMPTRVKCLHSMLAQSLAMGEGANPIGDWVLRRISDEFSPDVCRCVIRVHHDRHACQERGR